MDAAAPGPHDEIPLERVGTVRVEKLLGRGAMGEVYSGVDEALGRPVAVKVLAEVKDAEAAERFDREAHALARLAHPNVVSVFNKGVVGGRPYFVMELVDGPSVQAILDGQGPFAPGEAMMVVRQAAAGLQAASEAGVVHRDIKPGNLLVARDGTVKVADFGVCRLREGASGLTEEGTTLGTPFYMAPEQARGEVVDERADQYALGATLYHLLSGRPPYGVTQTVAQLLAHQKEPVPDVAEHAPGVSPQLAAVIRRMMAKSPAERFPTYDALLDALDEAAVPAPPPSRVARAGFLGLAAAAGVVAGAAWWWLEPGTSAASAGNPGEAPPVVVVAEARPPAPVLPPATSVVPPQPIAAPPAPPPTEAASPPLPTPAAPDPPVTPSSDVDAYLDAADRERGPARVAALSALARSGDARARPALEVVLRGKDDPEAPLAAMLLGDMGDQAATDALVHALGSPRRATVLAAVDALSALRDIRAIQPLQDLAARHDDPTVRSRAARARALLFGVEEAAR